MGSVIIRDVKELPASLQYASRWADMLERLRRHSEETNAALLPMTSAGPLAEIRRVLGEAREFVEGLAAETNGEGTTDYRRRLVSGTMRP